MSTAAASVSTMSGKVGYLLIAAFLLALDQVSKLWAYRVLREGDDLDFIPGLLKLSYTENPGIAFGMLSDGDVKWLLVAISVAAIGIVIFYMTRTPATNGLLLWSLALLTAGISGNLIDRVRMGRVIDFIEIYYRTFHWPVFNVADTVITIGAALMAIDLFLAPQPDREPDAPPPVAESVPVGERIPVGETTGEDS